MRRVYLRAAAAAGWLLVCAPAWAGGGGGYATEFTQILNNIELVKMVAQEAQEIENQLKMLEDMVRNTLALPEAVWGNTLGALMRLADVVRQGQALAYSLSNLDQEFRNRFKDYPSYLTHQYGVGELSAKYRQWSTETLDTVRASLDAVHLQAEDFTDEEATLRQLQHFSETASGRMQALQAGNQIAAQQVRQTQLLRQLMMTQMQMQGAYLAAQTDRDNLQKAQSELFFGAMPGTVVGDEPGYGPGGVVPPAATR
jgi:P-type conjugative transfer protein TrbJ